MISDSMITTIYSTNSMDLYLRVDFLLRWMDETIVSPIAVFAAVMAIRKIEKKSPFHSRLSKKSKNVKKFT